MTSISGRPGAATPGTSRRLVKAALGALVATVASGMLGITPAHALVNPQLTITASPSTTVGLQIFANSNLMGASNPTGTLTFKLFAPADTSCVSTVFTSTVPVTSTSVNSERFTTTQAGTWRWTSTYSGDANHAAAGPTSCSDTAAAVVVGRARTVLSVSASPLSGGVLQGTTSLSGGYAPTGTIAFDLNLTSSSDQFCSSPPVFTGSVGVTGAGTYTSAGYAPSSTGTYVWRAKYTGDANNLGVSITGCLDSAAQVTVDLSGTGSTPSVPGPPTNVVATGGDGGISVSWAPPTSGPTAAGFGVFVYGAAGYTGKGAWVCGTCTSAVVTGLANGEQYVAAVYGHDGTGWGAGGTSNAAWVLAVPGVPLDLGVAPGNGSLTMTWRAPTNPGTRIDGYAVYIYGAGGYTGKSVWACGTCTSAVVSGLTNGTSYYAVAYAHNANGSGGQATSPSAVVGAPGAPGNVTASKTNAELSVSWTPASDSGSALAGYGIWVYDASGYTGISAWVCATCTTTKIAGLATGNAYTVAVYGYNTFGWGVAGRSTAVTL